MTNEACTIVPPSAHYSPDPRALHITRMVIDDPLVIGELPHWSAGSRGPACSEAELAEADLTAFCRQALAAGAVAIRAASGTQVTQHLDRVIDEVGRRAAQVSREAAGTTTAAAAQATEAMSKATELAQRTLLQASKAAREGLTEHLDRTRAAMLEEVQRLVGGDDPVLATKLSSLLTEFGTQLDTRVNARTDELFSKAARQLDPRDPTSPLAEFTKGIGAQHAALTARLDIGQQAIKDSLDKLTDAVTASHVATSATAALRAVSPIKGGDFQDAVRDQLQTLAGHCGDEYVDTASKTGLIARCLKGDGVLTVALPGGTGVGRVVVETSDADTARRQWHVYLEEAERNRDAHASLGIVRTVDQMPGGDRLRVFGPRRIVLAHDPNVDSPDLLRAAVQLLRNQALLAASRTGNEQLHTVEEKLTEASDCLNKLGEIQRAAGNIRKGADKIDSECAGLHTSLHRLLAEASAALNGVSSTGEAVTAA